MPAERSPRPTLVQSLAVLIPGIVIAALSLGRVVASLRGDAPELALGPVIGLCIGGLLFAVGFMMTIVAVVRPFFANRPQDQLADSTARAVVDRQLRQAEPADGLQRREH